MMKDKLTLTFLLMTALLCSSCKQGWNDENKKAFLQTCMTGTQISDPDQKKNYCDCALEKTMAHYQTIAAVVANKDSTQMSAVLMECYNQNVK